jgi:hypothetical protein
MAKKACGKRRGIPGRIQCVEHMWFVDYTDPNTGRPARLPVSDEEAWNFDIENNLPILFRLRLGKVKIVSRKGNKRFVVIGSPA